jgi:hypothetical protein
MLYGNIAVFDPQSLSIRALGKAADNDIRLHSGTPAMPLSTR